MNGSLQHGLSFMVPGQDRVCQLHILCKGLGRVIATANGVGSCNNRAPCLQAGHNASLGDRDALLLHGLYTQPVQVSMAKHYGLTDLCQGPLDPTS